MVKDSKHSILWYVRSYRFPGLIYLPATTKVIVNWKF